ncbi:MAG: Glyoxylate/hydroxypyruvate reductase B [Candidatus Erwinia impunctatus]|nr:Glyoxylate/hydroxypyruvate reductase B [Culicoides impunctatus]
MKPTVVLYKTLPDDLYQQLCNHCHVVAVDNLTDDVLLQQAEHFQRAEGLLGAGGKINAPFLEKMPHLRAVSTISVGYDNIDVTALNARKIALMHTPTVLTDTVADTMVALMLATSRRVVELAERVKAGLWQHSVSADWFGTDVHHKTIGILGMGRIGMALAQRAHHGFNMPVLYHARKKHPEAESRFSARYCDLDTLLKNADFLCITLPLTAETHHLIGEKELAKMKSTAILINAGRGAVIDEQALITALQQGVIHAAGLDVFETEPLPASSPLLSLPNVVALPHIGSATHETRYAMAKDAVENMLAALAGNVQKNCVNPDVLH